MRRAIAPLIVQTLAKGKFKPNELNRILATAWVRFQHAEAHASSRSVDYDEELRRKRDLSHQATSSLPPWSESDLSALYLDLLTYRPPPTDIPESLIGHTSNPSISAPPTEDVVLDDFLASVEEAVIAAESETHNELQLPVTIATLSEWRAAIQKALEKGSREQLFKTLDLLARSGMPSVESVYAHTLGSVQDPRLAVDILNLAEQHLAIQPELHDQVIQSYLTSNDPFGASRHLRSMEEAKIQPLESSYVSVISALVKTSRPAAWDLFAHMRFVAHPTPSRAAFNTMIAACASGLYPSPERALDLFTEMGELGNTPDVATYNGLIRACARTRRPGEDSFYLQGIEFLRRMLSDGLEPTKETMHAVLEGSKRVGDLARARWVFAKSAQNGWLDDVMVANLFQAYATYKTSRHVPSSKLSNASLEADSSATLDQASLKHASSDMQPVTVASEEQTTSFPGPMPQTDDHVLNQICALMARVMATCNAKTDLLPSLSQHDTDPFFTGVRLSPYLANSFLLAYTAHANFKKVLPLYNQLLTDLGVEKTGMYYELVMEGCEKPRRKPAGLKAARRFFKEWQAWGQGRPLKETHAQAVWTSMIRNFCRNELVDEAMQETHRFVQTLPPSTTEAFRAQQEALLALTPKPTLQLADKQYLETTATHWVAPKLVFRDIAPLHKLLMDHGRHQDVATLKRYLKQYAQV